MVIASVLTAALLGLDAPAAPAAPARRGATYDGRGRQAAFPPLLGTGAFEFRFRVTRDGRQVKHFALWGLKCALAPNAYREIDAVAGAGRIRRDGRVRLDLRARASKSSVRIAGHFLSNGRARGTLRYRDRAPGQGCKVDGTWTARAKPPPPPVVHFSGTTDAGTRVTFDRTVEAHPHVTRFNFGALRTSCGDSTLVATGKAISPPYDEFALPVRSGTFAGEYFAEAFFVDVAGRFDGPARVSGTVRYGDRDDCRTSDIQWSAARR